MKILTGTIALSISFILFIYLYGLKAASSVEYTPGLYFFPTILLIISLACYGARVYQFDKSLKKKK